MVDLYTARRLLCPSQAPKGLHLVTSEGKLTALLSHNVTFLVFLEQVIYYQILNEHLMQNPNVANNDNMMIHLHNANWLPHFIFSRYSGLA